MTLKGNLLHNVRLALLEIQTTQAFMVVLVTCKNEEDPIKNKGARMVTTLSITFNIAQGQLTHNRQWDLDRIQTHFKLL